MGALGDKREKAVCGHINSSTRVLNNQLTQVSLYRELVSEGPLSTHSLKSQYWVILVRKIILVKGWVCLEDRMFYIRILALAL